MKTAKYLAPLSIAALLVIAALFFRSPEKAAPMDADAKEEEQRSFVHDEKSGYKDPVQDGKREDIDQGGVFVESVEDKVIQPLNFKEFRDLLREDVFEATRVLYTFQDQVTIEPYLELIWREFGDNIEATQELDWARQLDPEHPLSAILLEQFVAMRSKGGPAYYKDLVQELESSVNYPTKNASIMIVMDLYETNPIDAMVWTSKLSQQQNREAALIALLGLWSNRDPEDAITFLDTAREHLNLDADLLSSTYARAAVIPDPLYAITIAEEIQNTKTREDTLREVLLKWHSSLPVDAQAWLQINRDKYPEFEGIFSNGE